jgi:hypothetical protein
LPKNKERKKLGDFHDPTHVVEEAEDVRNHGLPLYEVCSFGRTMDLTHKKLEATSLYKKLKSGYGGPREHPNLKLYKLIPGTGRKYLLMSTRG